MANEQPNDTSDSSRKYIDMRVPLWGLLTTAGGVAWLLVSMYFTTSQTAKDVTELQVTVKAGNTQVTTLAGEQALLRFRMENIEGDMRALKSSQGAQNSAPSYSPPPPTRRVP
ncbi:hypothetical protein J2W35_003313 [Variovorax boronicumulans]|jgi:hypothetical protein|uniref:hypothetical protein n=1 Tax=Variovorax boronicumulans TaxID=436515 RepID=UPI00277D44BD|nr:hypothetical protein [Variovorax boronicumulans]MDQ0082954.1 hypothetical protein [Variovorax boronicumulans]